MIDLNEPLLLDLLSLSVVANPESLAKFAGVTPDQQDIRDAILTLRACTAFTSFTALNLASILAVSPEQRDYAGLTS